MIDQLINLVKQNAGEEIIRNPAIPDNKNEEAITDVGQNIFAGIKDQIQKGNIQDVMAMFSQGGTAASPNPMVSQLISKVAASLASKFGVSPQTATQIASALIPKVIGQFTSKTKDPNDKDFDLQDVLGKLGGGKFNVGDLLENFGGGSGKGGFGGLGKMFGG